MHQSMLHLQPLSYRRKKNEYNRDQLLKGLFSIYRRKSNI